METIEQYESRCNAELAQRRAFRAEAGLSSALPPVIFVTWTAPGDESRAPSWDGVRPLVWDFDAREMDAPGFAPPSEGEVAHAVGASGIDLGSGDEATTPSRIADAIRGAIDQRRRSVALRWAPERSTLRVLIRTGEQAEAHTRREGRIARGFEAR